LCVKNTIYLLSFSFSYAIIKSDEEALKFALYNAVKGFPGSFFIASSCAAIACRVIIGSNKKPAAGQNLPPAAGFRVPPAARACARGISALDGTGRRSCLPGSSPCP